MLISHFTRNFLCLLSHCLTRAALRAFSPTSCSPSSRGPPARHTAGALDEVSMVILVCSLAPACSLATAANCSVSVAGTNCLRHHEEPIRGGLVTMRPAADGSICTRAVSRYFQVSSGCAGFRKPPVLAFASRPECCPVSLLACSAALYDGPTCCLFRLRCRRRTCTHLAAVT